MNLQDKNLVKQKLMNQTRLLKSLGVHGLLISDKKMLELNNIVDHSNDKNNNASNAVSYTHLTLPTKRIV